jgi:hypothetical protein
VYLGGQEPSYSDVWHIPSRCFVDVGFQKLDPFKEEISEPTPSTPPLSRQSIDEDPLAQPLTPRRTEISEPNICRKLLRRLTLRRPAPCCASQTQEGPYEATRIEGRDYRVNGVIPARCESPH